MSAVRIARHTTPMRLKCGDADEGCPVFHILAPSPSRPNNYSPAILSGSRHLSASTELVPNSLILYDMMYLFQLGRIAFLFLLDSYVPTLKQGLQNIHYGLKYIKIPRSKCFLDFDLDIEDVKLHLTVSTMSSDICLLSLSSSTLST